MFIIKLKSFIFNQLFIEFILLLSFNIVHVQDKYVLHEKFYHDTFLI